MSCLSVINQNPKISSCYEAVKPKPDHSQINLFIYTVLKWLNKIVLRLCFKKIIVTGKENIPKNGPFLLVSNHLSRFDGLLLYNLVNRPTHFMVTPNELKGFQGALIKSVGAFPANLKLKLIEHVKNIWAHNRVVAIFPEGDISHNGSTRHFKHGAAKLALTACFDGMVLPVIPAAISYDKTMKEAKINFGASIDLNDYISEFAQKPHLAIDALSTRLHREVSYGKYSLGDTRDKAILLGDDLNRPWLLAE